MSNEIQKAEQALNAARSNLETVQSAQSKKVTAAKTAFTAAPTEITAGALAEAERISQLLIAAAQERVDDAVAELLRLEKAAKMARLEELQNHFSSTAHHAYLETMAAQMAEHREALSRLAEEVIADADSRAASLYEYIDISRELNLTGDASIMIDSARNRIRTSLSKAGQLSYPLVASESRERYVVSGSTRNRAVETASETGIKFAFGA